MHSKTERIHRSQNSTPVLKDRPWPNRGSGQGCSDCSMLGVANWCCKNKFDKHTPQPAVAPSHLPHRLQRSSASPHSLCFITSYHKDESSGRACFWLKYTLCEVQLHANFKFRWQSTSTECWMLYATKTKHRREHTLWPPFVQKVGRQASKKQPATWAEELERGDH